MVQREKLAIMKANKKGPCSEREFWPFLKANKKEQISETGEASPTKIGIHACYINTYLHEFFEPIPID